MGALKLKNKSIWGHLDFEKVKQRPRNFQNSKKTNKAQDIEKQTFMKFGSQVAR